MQPLPVRAVEFQRKQAAPARQPRLDRRQKRFDALAGQRGNRQRRPGVAALDPVRSAPDAFAVRGAEVYLALANGAGGTKLTNEWFDKALDTVSTMRNWRVMTRLAELAAARH